jgi:hypothetical protein
MRERSKTMAEYIEREAAYPLAKKICDAVDSHPRVLLPRTILDLIDDLPAADVRPVVHGKWIWQDAPCFGNPYGSYKCECGCLMPHKTNFCPNCGADMREESNGT